MIEINDVEQGTPEWIRMRLGVVTASNADKIITSKGEPSKQAVAYMRTLAGEILSGEPANGFKSESMMKGNERECDSRNHYCLIHSVEILQVGFVFLNEDRRVGCSPDGLIDPSMGFETKNKDARVQIDQLEDGWNWKADHYHQCQAGMWICNRQAWALRSYSRGIKPIDVIVERDETFIKRYAELVDRFIFDLDKYVLKHRDESCI